jgi:hypothetical protein
MQNAIIVLTNASDEAVSFDPEYKDGLTSVYQATAISSTKALRPTLGLTMRKPQSGVNAKSTHKIIVPYIADESTGTRAEVTIFVDVVAPESAPVSVRQDARAYAQAYFDTAIVNDVIDNGAFPY